MAAVVHRLVDHFIGKDVEFGDRITVNILCSGQTKNFRQPGLGHFTADDLGGNRQIPQ